MFKKWRPFISLLSRESLAYFRLPIAYVFLSVFLSCWMGIVWFVDPFFESDEASLELFFSRLPWLYVFLVPALSMRLWAEDKRSGAWELLAASPLSRFAVVMGKFLGAYLVLSLGLLLSSSMVLTVAYLGEPDWPPILSGYLGAWLLGGACLALCLLLGSGTRNQITAFVWGSTALLLLALLGFAPFTDLFSALGLSAAWVDLVASFGFITHFIPFTRGVIAAQHAGFFIAVVVLFLGLSMQQDSASAWLFRLNQAGFTLLLLGVLALLPVWSLQYDCTQQQAYTLSPDTQRVLESLEEPVELTLYFSKSVEGLPLGLRHYVGRVHYLLERYGEMGGGKLRLRFVDTGKSLEAEQEAETRGIQGRILPYASQWWCLGLSLKQVDRYEAIPVLDPNREATLELEITQALVKLQRREALSLGILSRLPLWDKQGWRILRGLKQNYRCEALTSQALENSRQLLKRYSLLLLLHPPSLKPEQLEGLRAFLRAGGALVVLVDPLCLQEETLGDSTAIAQGFSSDLSGLLKDWGVLYPSDELAADFRGALKLPTPEGGVPFPIAMDIKNFNLKEPAVASLRSVRLITPGFFRLAAQPPAQLQFSVLLRTSTHSGSLYAGAVKVTADADIAQKVKKHYGAKTLGLLISGKFSGNKQQASSHAAVALIADVDFITDAVLQSQGPKTSLDGELGSFSDNAHLLLNLVDNLSGQKGLFALRSKGRLTRKFDRAHQLFVQIRDSYQDNFQAIALRQEEIKTAQKALIEEVQAFGQNNPESMGVPPRFTRKFRALHEEDQALELKDRQMKKQLHGQLRNLKLLLGLLNVLAAPAFLSLLALWVLGRRGFRATRRRAFSP